MPLLFLYRKTKEKCTLKVRRFRRCIYFIKGGDVNYGNCQKVLDSILTSML